MVTAPVDSTGELQGLTSAAVMYPILAPPAGSSVRETDPSSEGSGGREPSRPSLGPSLGPGARLDEAVGLCQAIDLDVVLAQAIPVRQPQPGTLFRRGVIDTYAEHFAAEEIDLVVIDHELTPVQQRNLERAWQRKVIDRTGLILEIFGRRARTREAQLQVELAALTFQRSRLVRSWTHLERQRGGLGFVGGPGESQLEIDRRLIDDKIAQLRRSLRDVERTRTLHREDRARRRQALVALVGYTNAGKSTLFNRLAEQDRYSADRLFATLDTKMATLNLPSGRPTMISDTVGFISDLPHQLVASFRATLQDAVDADLILHVIDGAEEAWAAQRSEVHRVLQTLGVDTQHDPRLVEVLNKSDKGIIVPDDDTAGMPALTVSAHSGEGLESLRAAIDARLGRGESVARLSVPLSDGKALAWLYEHGHVLERRDDESTAHLRVQMDAANRARFAQRHRRAPAHA